MPRPRPEQLSFRPGPGSTPPLGQWAQSHTELAPASASPTSGRMTLQRIDAGPLDWTAVALRCHVSTAAAGSGTITATLVLYPDDGSGGAPNWAGLLASGPVSLGTTGPRYVSGLTVPIRGGRTYWAGLSYYLSGTLTQNPVMQVYGNGTSLWIPDSATAGAASRGLDIAGLTGGAPTTAQTLSTTAVSGANVPVVNIQRSAT